MLNRTVPRSATSRNSAFSMSVVSASHQPLAARSLNHSNASKPCRRANSYGTRAGACFAVWFPMRMPTVAVLSLSGFQRSLDVEEVFGAQRAEVHRRDVLFQLLQRLEPRHRDREPA